MKDFRAPDTATADRSPDADLRRRAGRRPGPSRTRDKILTAARAAFADHGYDGATLRGIAAQAKVDPKLVRHFFGDKRTLFAEAIQLPVSGETLVAQIVHGDPEEIGQRIVRCFLEAWDPAESRNVLIALIRSAATQGASERAVHDIIADRVVAPIVGVLRTPDPELRASLVSAIMLGLAMQRYLTRIGPLASMKPVVVAAIVGPTIQQVLTGPLSGY